MFGEVPFCVVDGDSDVVQRIDSVLGQSLSDQVSHGCCIKWLPKCGFVPSTIGMRRRGAAASTALIHTSFGCYRSAVGHDTPAANKMRCVYWSSDVRTRFVAALWERHSPRGRGNLRRWLSSGADELFLSIAAGERGERASGGVLVPVLVRKKFSQQPMPDR